MVTLQEPGSRLNSLKPSTGPSRVASSGEEAGTTRRASAGPPCGDGWTRTAEVRTSDSAWRLSRRSRPPPKMGRLSGSGRRRPGSAKFFVFFIQGGDRQPLESIYSTWFHSLSQSALFCYSLYCEILRIHTSTLLGPFIAVPFRLRACHPGGDDRHRRGAIPEQHWADERCHPPECRLRREVRLFRMHRP